MKVARFAADGRIHEGIWRAGRLVVPSGAAFDPQAVTWLPPVATFSKMIGLALNYSDHAAELDQALPDNPYLMNGGGGTVTNRPSSLRTICQLPSCTFQ